MPKKQDRIGCSACVDVAAAVVAAPPPRRHNIQPNGI